ncbi:hypothetical protein OMW55_10685 [Sphingomonas sp. BN140010]|uniref:Uncharacterized protein n=1 Tax=Sphingomonas arvum TaxID=2992113 RepID=A0ABT3JGS6_9SPHN|nr:hypothetical protein [Sphingomonas sp. BN140010]MCW3798267.1 hypothetical protein [Sphingomonas sp. BN140010]
MTSAAFASAWDRALEQGYARLEMRVLQQQFDDVEEELERIDLTGDWDVPDPPVQDPARALQLLKHHQDRVTKTRVAPAAKDGEAGRKVQPQRASPPATDAEVVAALSERLAKFGAEIIAETPPPQPS